MTRTPIDKPQIRRRFHRAADSYDQVAVLQREVGERLIERLPLILMQPQTILDVGCGTGFCTRALQDHYRKARVIGLDLAPAMLQATRRRGRWLRPIRTVCADAERLPLASESMDMVFSNVALQWLPDLERVFAEFQRVLRPGGLLMFSSFGPDTLKELREAWAQVDDKPHVHEFIDMHDVGDALIQARFADPVMDMEAFTLTYDDPMGVLRDLRGLGAGNAASGRSRGLTTRRRLQAMCQAYEAAHQGPDGRIPASWEVVYGHAWASEGLPQRREGDTVSIRADHIPVRRR